MTICALFTLQELLQATGGQLLGPRSEPSAPFTLNTDTRTVQAGQWFIPLVGANFDGHTYLQEAFKAGVTGALVNQASVSQHPEWESNTNLVAVPDTLKAYMALAQFHRRRLKPGLKVIALTGSSGKTTTKDMLFAAFSQIKSTQKTQANYNNEIGVSQTLLALVPETELAIVEMGMRGPHQIDVLSLCAEPDVALITNVGPAHIEMLGSLEAIADAKLEIVAGLNPQTGVLITNGDDALLNTKTPSVWSSDWRRFQLTDAKNILRDGEGQRFEYQGHTVYLSVPGHHNVMNALSVLQAGEALGLPIEELIAGLAKFQPEGGRWNKQAISGLDNVWVINDAYNANPDSCRASLTAFFDWKTPELKRLLILGGMKELGPFSERYHRQLGQWLNTDAQLDRLITVGEEAQWIAAELNTQAFEHWHYDSVEAVLTDLQQYPLTNTVIFLKGSRAYGLEKIITGVSNSYKMKSCK